MKRIIWDEGTSSADPHLPIRYHSGAIHAKDQVLVNDQFPNYEVKGEFQAPSATTTSTGSGRGSTGAPTSSASRCG